MNRFFHFILVAVSLTPGLSEARNGNEIGNGGNLVAQEFIARGYVVHSYLSQLPAGKQILTPAQLVTFEKALKVTRVEALDEQLYDHLGAPVDARTIDDPKMPGQKMVQLNNQAWKDILDSRQGVYKLVFHEYLWVIGLDDTNYVISRRADFSANVPAPTPIVRTCGLTGKIEERIHDCAKPQEKGGFEELATRLVPVPVSGDPLERFDQPQFYTWRLVSRSADKLALWRDETSGMLWTDTSPKGDMLLVDAYKLCGANNGADLKAGLTLPFRAPNREDFNIAIKHGIAKALPNVVGVRFWAIYISDEYLAGIRVVINENGTASMIDYGLAANADMNNFARCVAPSLPVIGQ